MTRKAQSITESIAALSTKERADIAYWILQQLDDGTPEKQRNIDSAWSKELSQRRTLVRSGRVKCVDGDTVLRSVRNRNK